MLKVLVNIYNFMPIVFMAITAVSACVVAYVVLSKTGVIQRLVSKDFVIPKQTNRWLGIVSLLVFVLSVCLTSYAHAHTKYNVSVYNETSVSYQLRHLNHAYATNDGFTAELKSGAVVAYRLKNNETMKIVPYYAK